MTTADSERRRLASAEPWKAWGPYLSEREWSTVREDYSPDGAAWEFFPHDHARSRAYRWGEDGLGGVCDDRQRLCLAFAFWNGRDPILKERIFGLTGHEGNHGEDAKEYWWYLDSTPTHSWMRWRYVYPQAAFPYDELVGENGRRGRTDPEFELLDAGVFDDDRYWDIEVTYAKASPHDLCVRLRVQNAGPEEDTIDVLPTLWFRNTWAWGVHHERPELRAKEGRIVAEHQDLGRMTLVGGGRPDLLFCNNETNSERLWGTPGPTPYPKDGINDHLIHGAPTINPDEVGTKGALHYRLTIGPGRTREIRLRLTDGSEDLRVEWDHVLAERSREADAFYASLAPSASEEEAAIMRQAFAGLLWGKQFYHYSVARWLDGDPAGPVPAPARRRGRNAQWVHLDAREVISMPDPWEYPWFAAWDLGFHCAAIAHVDADFAKDQLLLMCREWYMHPNGQLPAYEWAFGDVNPPVHAWAALRVFEIDGGRDFGFLERVFQKLLLNFTWWVNQKDREGANVFEGGFLGLDNIGPIDRSAPLPEGGSLEQSDGTAWMATYCLNLLEMALLLADHDPAYEDMATKFFEHFAYIASAMNDKGLWDEEDGFYYDVLHLDGQTIPLRVRSTVGLIPVFAVTTLGRATLERLPHFAAHFAWFLGHKPQYADVVGHVHALGEHEGRLLSITNPERLQRVLRVAFDEDEFLSPHGLRSLSRRHQDAPFELRTGGMEATVDYEPAESTGPLFGGNSNWRGPVWFPVNCLMIESLVRYQRYFGDDVTVEVPTSSGHRYTLGQTAFLLAERLIGLFRNDERGRRPAFGGAARFQNDPAWHDAILFYEYFNAEDGAGLGASHQTGWTGLVADLIIRASAARARAGLGESPAIAPDRPIGHNPKS